ncbi:hypothetical protein [Oscillibacter sp.]|uniref:hypothetical protein n=1 Tax=Oscillibacter sp. TaxID=1945593 RepID=UPI0028AE5FD4|nr:hypothetical protein [Oscillibacter sp.]
MAIDILLLIDGSNNALVQRLFLNGGVQFAALGGGNLLGGVHLGTTIRKDVVNCVGIEKAVCKEFAVSLTQDYLAHVIAAGEPLRYLASVSRFWAGYSTSSMYIFHAPSMSMPERL